MGIELTNYEMKDVVTLEESVLARTTINTVSKESLLEHLVDTYTYGLKANEGHQITVNTLQQLNVTRDKALAYLSLTIPNWPVKNPEDRKNHEPWGKDSAKVIELAEKNRDFNVFRKAMIAFNTWCSRHYVAGTWTIKVVEPKKVEEKVEGTDNNEPKKTPATIEPPTDAQLNTLSELQIMSLFMKVIKASDKVSDDSKELVDELCKQIAVELEPELSATLG